LITIYKLIHALTWLENIICGIVIVKMYLHSCALLQLELAHKIVKVISPQVQYSNKNLFLIKTCFILQIVSHLNCYLSHV